jgi:arsenate reductase-like glutaredoxin family protein
VSHITLYGIPNCGTVKKARNYLGARGVGFAFYDDFKAGA